MTMIYARSRPQVRNFAADMGWSRPRGRIGPHSRIPQAINTNLPLQVTPGQLVFVRKATFEYKGPAATLQIGVGWKCPANDLLHPNSLNFNNGQNLIRAGDGGYGFTNLIGTPNASVFTPMTVTFVNPVVMVAPVLGTNIRVSGQSFTLSSSWSFSDAWIWMYDTSGGQSRIVETGFLVIDDDSKVIEVKSPVSAQSIQGLEVEYTL
ncbi:MAG: hypothetical protein Q7N50_08045 [Armatimonadota bacterium]|nr:hypothetical protein [Armatimonadota bacterium]